MRKKKSKNNYFFQSKNKIRFRGENKRKVE